MSAPNRPMPVLILGIWYIVVFCFSAFSLLAATLLVGLHASGVQMPIINIALGAISCFLALAGGVTLLQMNPASWQILIGRVAVDFITLVYVALHPVPVPANLANTPNASAIMGAAHAGGIIFSALMLIVNIAIALYARSVTTKPAVMEYYPPPVHQ